MDLVVLAGGLGTRLREAVPDLPKPMAPVGGRPFLEHLLVRLASDEIDRFVLSVGYKAEVIRGHFGEEYLGRPVLYVEEPEPLGTGGGLLEVVRQVQPSAPFVLVNGDTFFPVPLDELRAAHDAHGARVTMALRRVPDGTRYSPVHLAEDGAVREFGERGSRTGEARINGGVYLFQDLQEEAAGEPARASLEDELIPGWLRRGDRVLGVEFDRPFVDIGVPADYARAAEIMGVTPLPDGGSPGLEIVAIPPETPPDRRAAALNEAVRAASAPRVLVIPGALRPVPEEALRRVEEVFQLVERPFVRFLVPAEDPLSEVFAIRRVDFEALGGFRPPAGGGVPLPSDLAFRGRLQERMETVLLPPSAELSPAIPLPRIRRPRFHLCLANHGLAGCRTLADHRDWIRAGLEDLGYEITESRDLVRGGSVNIFFEYFAPGAGALFRDLRRAGYRSGVVALENFDGGGFNGLREPHWVARYQAFEEVAPELDFLWVGFRRSLPYYRQFAPASHLELGFSERLLPAAPSGDPPFGVGFWGTLTPYRIRILQEVARSVPLHLPDSFVTGRELQEYLSRIKVGLLVRPSEAWATPSPNRFGRLTLAGRATLSERSADEGGDDQPDRVTALTPVADAGPELVDRLRELVDGGWRAAAAEALERYRNEVPLSEVMERLLDETCLAGSAEPAVVPDRQLPVVVEPVLLFSLNGFNLVRLDSTLFCAARQTLGVIDLRRPPEELTAERGVENLRYGASLSDLVQWVREQGLYSALESPAPAPSPPPAPPPSAPPRRRRARRRGRERKRGAVRGARPGGTRWGRLPRRRA